MSKRARALVLGAMLAAMNLAGMTAVAQAQANDEPTRTQDARQPPTERQVGESTVTARSHHSSRPPQTPFSGGCWLGSAPPSPTGRPPR
jgi:hypothetical protein